MKFLISSVILLLALATASQALYFTLGKRNGTDYLLSRQTEVREPRKNNYVLSSVKFPRPGASNKQIITAIYVIDNFPDITGAIASLWSGGPGNRYAQINLKSLIGRGINSTVEFWGRDDENSG